jgi:dolichyl-phosphate beta-glucosyltransferase
MILSQNIDKDEIFLTIVIPAYNEAKRITRSLEDVKNFFRSADKSIEIIVVIEKSTDDTLLLARQSAGNDPRFQIIANEVQKGKGFAVRTGMLKARGKFAFFMDLDLSTPLVEVFNFLAYFDQHPETLVLIGSRQHPKSTLIKRQHPLRQKMGSIFNGLVQMFALKGISDTQCGFKAFRKEVVLPIFKRCKLNGFSFDVEVLMLAEALGFKFEALPVKWINAADSKVRMIQDSMKMFFDVLKIKSIVSKTMREKI